MPCSSSKRRFQVEIFQELARIFSEENNQWNLRDLMITEGTAKFAATAGENDKHMNKILQRQLLSGGVRILKITYIHDESVVVVYVACVCRSQRWHLNVLRSVTLDD